MTAQISLFPAPAPVPSGQHYHDCRTLALMIAHTYPCGWLEISSIGACWSPRFPDGRHWPERKARTVLADLVERGLVSVYEGFTGRIARTNEAGFRALDLHGQPAISDADAERWWHRDAAS